MDDLISRQKVLNAIERMRAYIGHNMERAVGSAFIEILDDIGEDIGRLPSIQLATDTNVGTKLGTDLAEVGTDLANKRVIDVEGLDEQIRCEMCVNPMHTDRGCDGNCKYDEKLYGRIIQILGERIKQLPSAEPEIIRCKDCKYYNSEEKECLDLFGHGRRWEEDDFCSYAERREVTT